jgi:hypothetical protein
VHDARERDRRGNADDAYTGTRQSSGANWHTHSLGGISRKNEIRRRLCW